MDIEVARVEDGRRFNRFGEEIIGCKWCGEPTTMLGTKCCDGCYNIESACRSRPAVVRKVLEKLHPVPKPDPRRDLFAAAALTGLIINPASCSAVAPISARAFELADAMLRVGSEEPS